MGKVWEEIGLGNFPVVADYIEIAAKNTVDFNKKWINVHCRISEYLLQIVRCNDSKYCGDFRTTWKSVISSHFLLAPVPFGQIPEESTVPSVSDIKASDRFVQLWKPMAFSSALLTLDSVRCHMICTV